jgi:glycosyltransferase involved in cell wall biosynthesis
MSEKWPVLVGHNLYRQPGGEDVVYNAETALLLAQGHKVTRYEQDNRTIGLGLTAAASAVWNMTSHRRVHALVASERAAVAHFHNTFPLISPSAYYAASDAGAAVVQTLHNYRLICPGALLSRDSTPCEECIGSKTLWPAMKHGCYRGSRTATASLVGMLGTHRAAGTYQHAVDAYIALTAFARERFIQGGLPSDRIFVKPNFVEDPGNGNGSGGYALFAGRLSSEKGVTVLARAWRDLPEIALTVAGTGPLESTSWPANVTVLGHQPHDTVIRLLRQASILVFPSTSYEGMSIAILEAFACGTPVIASDLGSMAEIVDHGRTGLLFKAGDPASLADQVKYAFSHPEHLAAMRINARQEYESKYTPEVNYRQLIQIYGHAIDNAKRRLRRAS